MKVQSITRSMTVAVAVLAFTGAGAEAASARAPIRPHQHFEGLVNGKQGHAIMYVVCPGPAGGHRTGPVKKGQTMAVLKTAHGTGNTGLFSHVYSWFQPVPSGKRPIALTFVRYGKSQTIPTSVRVPCAGKGEAVFSSCPYLAPCAAGFTQDPLTVKFENVATAPARGRDHRHR